MLAALSCQQPPLLSKHSFVSTSAVKKISTQKLVLGVKNTPSFSFFDRWKHIIHDNLLSIFGSKRKLGIYHQPNRQLALWFPQNLRKWPSKQHLSPISLGFTYFRNKRTKGGLIVWLKRHNYTNRPRYCRLFTTRVGNIVTSPRDPLPTYKTVHLLNSYMNDMVPPIVSCQGT